MLKLTEEDKQIEILKRVIKYGLTVRKTEELVEEALREPVEEEKARPLVIQHYIRDIRILTNSIKENLEMVRNMDSKFDMVQTEEGYDIHIKLAYTASN